MMNIINLIPENIGWIVVGATAMLTMMVATKLVKTLAAMVKDYMTDDCED